MSRIVADWQRSQWKRAKVSLTSLGAIGLAHLLGSTVRLKAESYHSVRDLRRGAGGLIFAMWHGPHFPVLWAYRRRGVCIMTSLSADGELLTRILEHFGYKCSRGSSTRGGKRVMVEMARILRKGGDVAIAVDGPKGPRYSVKGGVMTLAKLGHCAIVPVGAGMDRYWEFKSWDRYRLPKPLARGSVVTGEPIRIEPGDSDDVIEQKRRQLEQELRRVQVQADAMVGNDRPMDYPEPRPAAEGRDAS